MVWPPLIALYTHKITITYHWNPRMFSTYQIWLVIKKYCKTFQSWLQEWYYGCDPRLMDFSAPRNGNCLKLKKQNKIYKIIHNKNIERTRQRCFHIHVNIYQASCADVTRFQLLHAFCTHVICSRNKVKPWGKVSKIERRQKTHHFTGMSSYNAKKNKSAVTMKEVQLPAHFAAFTTPHTWSHYDQGFDRFASIFWPQRCTVPIPKKKQLDEVYRNTGNIGKYEICDDLPKCDHILFCFVSFSINRLLKTRKPPLTWRIWPTFILATNRQTWKKLTQFPHDYRHLNSFEVCVNEWKCAQNPLNCVTLNSEHRT